MRCFSSQSDLPLRAAWAFPHAGFPIRKSSADSACLAADRSLSQLATSFIGIQSRGIHVMRMSNISLVTRNYAVHMPLLSNAIQKDNEGRQAVRKHVLYRTMNPNLVSGSWDWYTCTALGINNFIMKLQLFFYLPVISRITAWRLIIRLNPSTRPRIARPRSGLFLLRKFVARFTRSQISFAENKKRMVIDHPQNQNSARNCEAFWTYGWRRVSIAKGYYIKVYGNATFSFDNFC